MVKEIKMYFYYPKWLEEKLKMHLKEETTLKVETYIHKYLYVVHILFWGRSNRKNYEKGIPVSMENLKKDLGIDNATVSNLIQHLVDWNIIRRVSGYTVGVKPFSYRLHEDLEVMEVNRNKIVAKRSNSFIVKLLRKRENEINALTGIEKYQFYVLVNHISLSPLAIDYLQHKYPELKSALLLYPNKIDIDGIDLLIPREDLILFSILFKDYFVNRPEKGNRLYNNLSSLKKDYRDFLLMDGVPIMNTDIKNSQVVYGAFLIKRYFNNCPNLNYESLPKDFIDFEILVLDGLIYEFLAKKKKFALTDENRKEFKQMFFGNVWYCNTPKYKNKFYEVFGTCFPNVRWCIEQIKKEDYKQFPIQLQKLEAEMMVDIVGKKLMEEGIKFLTIHDSFVLNNDEDVIYVNNVIKREFELMYNSSPSVALEKRKAQVVHGKWQPTFLFKYPSFFEDKGSKEHVKVRKW